MVLASRSAVAVGDDADGELLRRGTDAFGRKEYDDARVALGQAYALSSKAATLLKLGLAELQSGHAVDATKHLREYLTHAEEPADKLEAVRTKWLPRAVSQTASLDVTAPAGAEVLVDGVVQGSAPLGSIVIGEGSHEVTSRQGTLVETQTVVAKAGVAVEVHFQRVSDAIPAAIGPQGPDGEAQDRPSSGASRAKWITVIGLGSGAVAAFGVGIGFAVASNNSADQARTLSGQLNAMNAPSCNTASAPAGCGALSQAIQSTNADHGLAIGFEVAGGVLALGSAATWLLWHPAKQQTGRVQMQPMLNARGAGLTVGGEW
jgi:hypothetical protein